VSVLFEFLNKTRRGPRDRIHKRLRKFSTIVAVQGTVFTKDLENFQQNFLLLPELTM